MGVPSTPRLLLVALALGACAATPPPGPPDPLDALRADLVSGDPERSLAAAMELEPESLDLVELRTQARILAEHPEEVLATDGDCFDCPGGRSIGSPEVLRLLETAAAAGIEAEEHSIRDLHRMLVQEHIPGLAALRARVAGPVQDHLTWMLRLLAGNTDRHRWSVDLKLRLDPPEPPDTAVRREAFSPEEARRRVAALARKPPPDGEAWEEYLKEAPVIDGAAPGALDAVLAAWEKAEDRSLARYAREGRRSLAAPPGSGDLAKAEEVLADLARGGEPDRSIGFLGLLGKRGRPLLERFRSERSREVYWPATAGLAIAGDAAAREEFLAFLGDDRVFVYDSSFDPVVFTLNGDPDALAHWRSRVGSNCCLWFYAWEALRRWYPTMPAENRVGDGQPTELRARLWWDRWKDRLAWSRLANGWVPVER